MSLKSCRVVGDFYQLFGPQRESFFPILRYIQYDALSRSNAYDLFEKEWLML